MPIQIVHLFKKNKFGCNIYYIQLDILHRIEMNETTNGTYIIEFFELGILWPTRIFSFTSSNNIYDVVSESMDRVANYYRTSKRHNVPESLFIEDKKQAMKEAYRMFKS